MRNFIRRVIDTMLGPPPVLRWRKAMRRMRAQDRYIKNLESYIQQLEEDIEEVKMNHMGETHIEGAK